MVAQASGPDLAAWAEVIRAASPILEALIALAGVIFSLGQNRLEALYVLAVHTGMRRGELLGIKWSDVDLDTATIRVRRTLTRTVNGRRLALGEPKTKNSRRTVRLTQRAVEALRSQRAGQAEERS